MKDSKTVAILAHILVVVSAPIVEGAAGRQIWNWFMYERPRIPFAHWYAAAAIVHVALWRLSVARTDEGKMKWMSASEVLARASIVWGSLWLSVVTTWCVGAVCGWVKPL